MISPPVPPTQLDNVECLDDDRPTGPFSTNSASPMVPANFRPSRLDSVEYLEDYKPTGFHPLVVGDTLAQGRYRIIHKLGFGGSSTVWLARNPTGKLVTLKVMCADVSSKPLDEIPDLVVPRKIFGHLKAQDPVPQACSNIQNVEDHFIENGPNGSHLCLVYDFAGPSLLDMSHAPGRVRGSRRLRGDLARKVARQVVGAVELMHSAGFVHGDLTTSNILLQVADSVKHWSDSDVYAHLGPPVSEEVSNRMQGPLVPSLPPRLYAPIKISHLANSTFLKEDALLIDFGQSFPIFHPPRDYEPATVPHYQSPEAYFDQKIDLSSDIWSLACTIFELRAGFPLFDDFFGVSDEILKEMVATLGRLPDPWWCAFENRSRWFDEDGTPKDEELQKTPLPAIKTSIEHQLASIGSRDMPPVRGTDGPMMERPGTRLDDTEIQLLRDLLEKMLRYLPEERIQIKEVVSHPWFTLE